MKGQWSQCDGDLETEASLSFTWSVKQWQCAGVEEEILYGGLAGAVQYGDYRLLRPDWAAEFRFMLK